ncbi:hypothetical protein [Neobacillus niacini]|uniref:hypothetical protein n=1 Tax=Neobacillus niacini TaxID=86668 RepID=UPI0021CB0381|nr:hypothetical protein [Neobacillus niacini]MCM3764508.1 hypothetical protein [Neobacillus niacini]
MGSKSTLIILLLYVLLWRVTYTISLIGQLKTNIPIFLALCFLLLVMFIHIIVVYRKYMKQDWIYQSASQIEINEKQFVFVSRNSIDRYVIPMGTLTKVKENKKWYFLYFQDHMFVPILKVTGYTPDQKPARPILWKWTVLIFSLVTILGGYYVGSNTVNFRGALAWKIFEWRTETRLKLEDDNFYTTRLEGIIDAVKAETELEPYLMTNDLKIEFNKDGTITDIYTYIYGFDENQKLQSGYLIYTKGNKFKLHKQDWKGQGTAFYNPNNDLTIVIKMLNWIPVKEEVKQWNEEKNAVLYKGIRDWRSPDGIRFIDEKGKIYIPAMTETETGPTVSLYIPGKEDLITPKRYIYEPFYRGDY